MLKFYEFEKNEKRPHYVYEDGHNTIPFSDKLNTFKDAGIKIPSSIVVVDFDNHTNSEFVSKQLPIIIDYFDNRYPTFKVKTNTGFHLYFRKPSGVVIKNWNSITTGYGIPVDYKTNVYVTIKQNGKVRETNKPLSELNFLSLPELPKALYPIIKSKNINMFGMGVGERDSSLYNHLLNVKETIPDIDISAVANFINDYLFSEPLDKKQLQEKIDNITKKGSSAIDYSGDPKDMIEFAEWLVKKLDIKWYKGNIYFYDDVKKVYVDDTVLLLRKVTQYLRLKRAQDTELLHQIPKFCERVKENEILPVHFNNAILDTTGEIIPLNEHVFTVFNLDVNYNPKAYDKNVDDFLNNITLNRKDLRNILEEILGHILMSNGFPAHVFFLKGNGKNGKSTFLEMINNFVGDVGNQISLEDFNDATSVASLIGKLVNCSDETEQIFIDRCKGYKSLASGNTIKVRPIYSKPIQVKNTATLILNANKMPNFNDKTGGFFRRLKIIPFDMDLEKNPKKINSNLIDNLSTPNAKSYILNLALDGYKRIKSNGNTISSSELIDKEIKSYREDTDSVIAYLNDYSDIHDNYTSLVYAQYQAFCEEVGNKPVSLKEFSSRLKDLGYEVRPKSFKNSDGSWTTKRGYYKK